MTVEIFFSCDNELSEWEAVNKEWRSDVYVLCDGWVFQLNIYTPVRLLQDFDAEMKDSGFYSVDANLVLVSATDKNTIISTILKLYDENYFERIKPLAEQKLNFLVKVY